MRISDLPDYLRSLRDAVAKAINPADGAMAEAFRDRVVNVTLRETVHAPGEFWKAAPHRPPAYASGGLARSVILTRDGRKASVGVYARYAALQEFGGVTWPSNHRYMHWVNTGGAWYKERVRVPEHPYFRPTLDAMVRDGMLSRSAADAFYDRISYFYTG